MQDRLPLAFSELIDHLVAFADPVLEGSAPGARWDPTARAWERP
jgi:hypothetical protein